MRARHLFAAGLLICTVAVTAQAQSVSLVDPQCIPHKGNGVVKAAVIPDPAVGQSPRLYFRWKGQPAFYWVAMEVEPNGQYWSVLPRPEDRNEEVELYGAVVDPAGKMLSQSMVRSIKVRDCQVNLTPKEQGLADNLTIGETASSQYRKRVIGFLCPGIKIRIDPQGVKRADEECGPCGLAWLPPGLATAGAVLGVVIGDRTPREASPSRP
ncbi:MAG TPA: hypothetical protein VH394_04075 [Thermoanaerobaculia bacterium]|jgi:hypothetical protein|nr:hypothetical protein [Thermoanaerobaculia bacterium]